MPDRQRVHQARRRPWRAHDRVADLGHPGGAPTYPGPQGRSTTPARADPIGLALAGQGDSADRHRRHPGGRCRGRGSRRPGLWRLPSKGLMSKCADRRCRAGPSTLGGPRATRGGPDGSGRPAVRGSDPDGVEERRRRSGILHRDRPDPGPPDARSGLGRGRSAIARGGRCPSASSASGWSCASVSTAGDRLDVGLTLWTPSLPFLAGDFKVHIDHVARIQAAGIDPYHDTDDRICAIYPYPPMLGRLFAWVTWFETLTAAAALARRRWR